MLQYLTPSLQMTWGVVVLGEDMPASRWIGFVLIWIALAVYSTDASCGPVVSVPWSPRSLARLRLVSAHRHPGRGTRG